jgi:hypothetical protein
MYLKIVKHCLTCQREREVLSGKNPTRVSLNLSNREHFFCDYCGGYSIRLDISIEVDTNVNREGWVDGIEVTYPQ